MVYEENVDQEDNKEDDDFMEKTQDSVGAFYMKMEKSEWFDTSSVFVIDIQVSKHNIQKVIEEKENDLKSS